MSQGFAGVLELLLAPPGGMLWLILAGLWLIRSRPRWGYGLAGVGLALLYLLSTPLVADGLLDSLQTEPALDPAKLDQTGAEAIVILGAGRREDTPEYGGDTLSPQALERVRYGAWLARRTGLPLLVSGGLGKPGHVPEALLMQQVLSQEYGLQPRWLEGRSRNTYENAQFSSELLRAAGIKRVYVVSHAWHMPRIEFSFRGFGIEVVPAPTAFETQGSAGVIVNDLLPNARAQAKSASAFHELLGNAWYRLRY